MAANITQTTVSHNGERRQGAVLTRPGEDRARPGRSSTAAEVVLAYLRDQVAALHSLEPSVRRDEPDAVHQMRVATRRLRGTLRSFGDVIPRAETGRLAEEIKWLGGLLGPVRDGEVLSEHLHATAGTVPVELLIGPVQARIQGHYAPVRAQARTELIAALDSQRYARLLADLDRLTLEPPLGPRATAPAREVLPAAVRKAYRQAKRRMRRAGNAPPGQRRDTGLHEARKSARRARSAAEAATPAVGKKAGTFAKRMKKVQSVIGEHHDTVLARQAARELGIGAHLAGENAYSYGLLGERESRRADELEASARRTWKKSSRRRYRKWM
jgi:CHAD domain-containing protein